MRTGRTTAAILLLSFLFSCNQGNAPEQRAKALLKQMTLHEKCLQLQNRHITSVNDFDSVFGEESVGTIHNMTLDWEGCRQLMDSLQRYMASRTRLGIPVLPCVEGVEGVLQNGCTIFPCPLAQGSTFNPTLIYEATSAEGEEALSLGLHQILSPVLDIARDLRWGRIEETFGEDPYLISRMGTAFVSGYQESGRITCTPKHFAAHGTPVGGINCASVSGGPRELYSTYLYPFRKVISDAHPRAIMTCYSSYDGEPVSGSKRFLTDILRGELGFDGYVYSDWGSVEQLYNFHYSVPTREEAAVKALKAGLDLNIDGTCQLLESEVEKGNLEEKYIDRAVLRILETKFRLGLFDNPYSTGSPIRSEKAVALSRKVAEESAVLLKNNGILPLDPGRASRLAVVGPNAAQAVFGDYSWTARENSEGVSLLQGLEDALGDKARIQYSQGCDSWSDDGCGIAEAVRAARNSDIVIAAVGTHSTYLGRDHRNETSGEGYDLSSLDLPGRQQDLLEALKATGKPLVVVLISGKPLAIPWVKDNADAILVQWYAGERQGEVLADILLGKVNPSGRLNVSFPRSTGATPCYYNYYLTDKNYKGYMGGTPENPSGRYVGDSCYPLWEFGYGLSYSEFSYDGFKCSLDEGKQAVSLEVTVHNNSGRDGKDVVQAYVRDCVCSFETQIKQLKAFSKVEVPAHGSVTVRLEIPVSELGIYDNGLNYYVESGDFDFMLGSSSDNIYFQETITI